MAASIVTAAQIRTLRLMLSEYHAKHEDVHGPEATCREATCVEGKWAIEWLTRRGVAGAVLAVTGSSFAYMRHQHVVGTVCLRCNRALAWSEHIDNLRIVQRAHRCGAPRLAPVFPLRERR